MADDWDIPAPKQASLPPQGIPGKIMGVGRGRGLPRPTSDEWGAPSASAAAPKTAPVDDWGAPAAASKSAAAAASEWDAPPAAPAGRGGLTAKMGGMKIADESWGTPNVETAGAKWGANPAETPSVEAWGAPGGSSVPDNSWTNPPAQSKGPAQPRGASWAPSNGMSNGVSSGGGGGSSRACFKCNQEGHMSRECPNAPAGGGGGSRACHKCNQEGHMARECPNAPAGGSRACHKCNQEGHMARECPNAPAGGGSRACHKCNEEGHMARECPNAGSGGGGGGPRNCFKCGEEGHVSRDCPQGGGDSGAPRACYKCHSTEHATKDCTEPFSEVTADGKPREQYIPQETAEDELYKNSIAKGSNFSNFDRVALQVTGQNVPDYIRSFESAGLRDLVLQNIKASGYETPTPVQKGAIAVILAKRDLIASAVTGSGKTGAYLIPVINILLEKGVPGGSPGMIQKPEVVILAPTRELAIQIHQEARKFSNKSVLKCAIVYGGTVVSHQRSQVQSGVNILVATPGRLKDFVERQVLDFSGVQFFILDEADRMLDMGFGPDIERIINHSTMPPVNVRRTMMFSATFPAEVQGLAANYLHDYVFVTTGTVGGTNPDVMQEFHEVTRGEKRNKLIEVLRDVGTAKTIVFVESKKTADFIAAFICNSDLKATSIHGDRLQSQREQALRDFRRNDRNILVATNVAARGLDIAGVEYVVNYDLPDDVEEYVHRIGRTGRVGNVGKSISFFDTERDREKAGKLVEKLVASNADIPPFLQSMVSGMGGMSYNFNAPSTQSGFASRDVRKFGSAAAAPMEQEEGWD